MPKTMKRNKRRTRGFNIPMTEEEYELVMQAAAMSDSAGAAWARDILISRALRARRLGLAA